MAVVEALAFVGEFYLTLVEDGFEHLGTIATDGGIESAVAFIAHTTAYLDEGIPGFVEMLGSAGCLGKIEQHFGIAHGNHGRTVAGEAVLVGEVIIGMVAEGGIERFLADVDGTSVVAEILGEIAFLRVVPELFERGIPGVVLQLILGAAAVRYGMLGDVDIAYEPPFGAGEGEGAIEAWVTVEEEQLAVVGVGSCLRGALAVGHGEEIDHLSGGRERVAAAVASEGCGGTDVLLP